MRRTLLPGLALLLALPGLAPGVPAAADAFEVPPFRVGATATYAIETADGWTGTRETSVGERFTTLDAAARPAEVFGIRWGDSEQRVSMRTFTLENRRTECVMRSDGECSPFYSLDWTGQGAPGALGATLLQGRRFAVGDAWEQAGTCLYCLSPLRVAIEPPGPDSPPGTAYVARVSVHRDPYAPEELRGSRLHMGDATPFPLLARFDGSWGVVRAELLSFQEGPGEALVPPAPPPAPDVPPVFRALPFEHNRPVEGTPPPGRLSWSDARNATGPDPGDAEPGAAFLGVDFPGGSGYTRVSPQGILVYRADEHELSSTYARPDKPDLVTTYRHSARQVLGQPVDLGDLDWSKQETEAPPTEVGTCRSESAPLWDLFRHAGATRYLGEARGFFVDRVGHYGIPTCRPHETLQVTGDRLPILEGPGFSLAILEDMTINLQTGHLEHGFLLPHEGAPR